MSSGLWLIEASNGVYSLGDWLDRGSLGLLLLAFALGAVGGQRPKRARRLAERLAGDSVDGPTEELRALLDDAR